MREPDAMAYFSPVPGVTLKSIAGRVSSGVVRPGAKLTQMEGSLAAPMLDGDRLHGVLGVAKPVAYDFTAAEQQLLLAIGTTIARTRR